MTAVVAEPGAAGGLSAAASSPSSSPCRDEHAGARPGVCVFDVDGTLLPGSLGFELARHLAAVGVAVDLTGLRAVMSAYRAGQVDHRTMTVASHRIYAAGLSGLAVDDVRDAAATVWDQVGDQVFDYVRPLIARLRGAGYRVLLISGSPAEIVGAAAASLGAAGSAGAQLATASGRYLPRVVAAPAMPGGKSRALRMLTATDDAGAAEPTCTLALGNTRTDTEILRRVRHPFAFEPDRALARAAAANGWPVVDRDSALERVGRIADCTRAHKADPTTDRTGGPR